MARQFHPHMTLRLGRVRNIVEGVKRNEAGYRAADVQDMRPLGGARRRGHTYFARVGFDGFQQPCEAPRSERIQVMDGVKGELHQSHYFDFRCDHLVSLSPFEELGVYGTKFWKVNRGKG